MKTIAKVKFILLSLVLVSILYLLLSCQMEEVTDFPEKAGIEDVMGGLAASTSDVEAEAAIRSLLNKATIGTPFPESSYGAYDFSDEDIADLAELHILYVNGEVEPSLGYTFEAVMRIADYLSVPKMEFSTTMDALEGQTAHALIDPEEPENAILAAIAAEGGRIPLAAPPYDEDTIRSPIQTVLFGLWLDREFARPSGASTAGGDTRFAPAKDQLEKCRDKCYARYLKDVLKCLRNFPPGSERDECLKEAMDEFLECLEGCHDQGQSSND